MLKQVQAQADPVFLLKLFDIYIELQDEKEIIKNASKIIQKPDKFPSRDKLIEVFDRLYEIISRHRKVFREVTEVESHETMDKVKSKYLREYKEDLSKQLSEILRKIIKEVKKGLIATSYSVSFISN